MKNKKLIRFAQSLIVLPVMGVSVPIGNINAPVAQVSPSALVQQMNIGTNGLLSLKEDTAAEDLLLEKKGEAIDAYFREHDMPLEGNGKKMAEEAEKNGLDWRLVAAISVRESTGGKHDCNKVKHNAFGWGSCKIGFKTDAQAIETVARNLGGNNPNTAHHYENKTTIGILRAYNPPSVVPKYAEQVISIMDDIGEANMTIEIVSKV